MEGSRARQPSDAGKSRAAKVQWANVEILLKKEPAAIQFSNSISKLNLLENCRNKHT
jgi:hypothetical protein